MFCRTGRRVGESWGFAGSGEASKELETVSGRQKENFALTKA